MKTFRCAKCSQPVFFENVICEHCGSLLGYVPEIGEISAFEPAGEGLWHSLHAEALDQTYRQCHNYVVENVCNWMIPADSSSALCDRMTPLLWKAGVVNNPVVAAFFGSVCV